MAVVFCKILMFGQGNVAVAQEKGAGESGMVSSKSQSRDTPTSVPEKNPYGPEDMGQVKLEDKPQDVKVANDKSKDETKDKKVESEKSTQAEESKVNTTFNPMKLTSNEIKVLETLSERRQEIDEKDKKIGLRMALLQASEQRMDQKIEVLQNLRLVIEGLLKKYDSQEKENFKTLAKIYEKMKPKEAARIFSELDMPILLNVITYIKDVKASQIISYMETKRARDLTLALAKERQKKDEAQQQLNNTNANERAAQGQ